MVVFGDEAQLPQLLEGERIRRTTLTEYFTANRHVAERVTREERLEVDEVDCRESRFVKPTVPIARNS